MTFFSQDNILDNEIACEEEYMEPFTLSKTQFLMQNADCKPCLNYPNSSTHMEGDPSQIVKTYESATKTKENDVEKKVSHLNFVIAMPMTIRDYRAVLYFGRKNDWFRKITSQITHINGNFECSLPYLSVDEDTFQITETKITDLLKGIQQMSSDYIPIDNKDIDLNKALQYVEQAKLNVCLICKTNDIEIISDDYKELQRAKRLLQQKIARKAFNRPGRYSSFMDTFFEIFRNGRTNEDNSSNQMYQSMISPKVEFTTKEGLIIKIYSCSITCLDVDCIVNAANENLTHNDGVAAAISESAGYQFNLESRYYVNTNGLIPVGRCCVTSAGKLPYIYVIHTVGPRWGDYKDKNQCLQDLQESVEGTFMEADIKGMNSIAIPAISAGKFALFDPESFR